MTSEQLSADQRCSPPQLRRDAETCDEILPGPIAADLRWAADEIERLTLAHKAASDFMRGCIEAVGYKGQPPAGFLVDTEALRLQVVGEIERWKVLAHE